MKKKALIFAICELFSIVAMFYVSCVLLKSVWAYAVAGANFINVKYFDVFGVHYLWLVATLILSLEFSELRKIHSHKK